MTELDKMKLLKIRGEIKELESGYNHLTPISTTEQLLRLYFNMPDGIEKDNIKIWLQLEVLK